MIYQLLITLLTSQHVGPIMRGEELLANPNVRGEELLAESNLRGDELLAGHNMGEGELEVQVGLAVGPSPR